MNGIDFHTIIRTSERVGMEEEWDGAHRRKIIKLFVHPRGASKQEQIGWTTSRAKGEKSCAIFPFCQPYIQSVTHPISTHSNSIAPTPFISNTFHLLNSTEFIALALGPSSHNTFIASLLPYNILPLFYLTWMDSSSSNNSTIASFYYRYGLKPQIPT